MTDQVTPTPIPYDEMTDAQVLAEARRLAHEHLDVDTARDGRSALADLFALLTQDEPAQRRPSELTIELSDGPDWADTLVGVGGDCVDVRLYTGELIEGVVLNEIDRDEADGFERLVLLPLGSPAEWNDDKVRKVRIDEVERIILF